MKFKNILILSTLFLGFTEVSGNCIPVNQFNQSQADSVYLQKDVDVAPEPVKGMKEFYESLGKSFRYPAGARERNIQGKLFFYLVIDKNGQVIESGIHEGLEKSLDQETLDTLKRIKIKWKAGIKNGKNVSVKIVIPFSLNLA